MRNPYSVPAAPQLVSTCPISVKRLHEAHELNHRSTFLVEIHVQGPGVHIAHIVIRASHVEVDTKGIRVVTKLWNHEFSFDCVRTRWVDCGAFADEVLIQWCIREHLKSIGFH